MAANSGSVWVVPLRERLLTSGFLLGCELSLTKQAPAPGALRPCWEDAQNPEPTAPRSSGRQLRARVGIGADGPHEDRCVAFGRASCRVPFPARGWLPDQVHRALRARLEGCAGKEHLRFPTRCRRRARYSTDRDHVAPSVVIWPAPLGDDIGSPHRAVDQARARDPCSRRRTGWR